MGLKILASVSITYVFDSAMTYCNLICKQRKEYVLVQFKCQFVNHHDTVAMCYYHNTLKTLKSKILDIITV